MTKTDTLKRSRPYLLERLRWDSTGEVAAYHIIHTTTTTGRTVVESFSPEDYGDQHDRDEQAAEDAALAAWEAEYT